MSEATGSSRELLLTTPDPAVFAPCTAARVLRCCIAVAVLPEGLSPDDDSASCEDEDDKEEDEDEDEYEVGNACVCCVCSCVCCWVCC